MNTIIMNIQHNCALIWMLLFCLHLSLFVTFLFQVVQIYHQKWNYLDFENLLEWCVYGLAILFVAPISPYLYPYGDGAGEIRVREASIPWFLLLLLLKSHALTVTMRMNLMC